MPTTSYLPPEIIEAILLKSSFKPLRRFKSVSKSWNALISHPLFIKNHHQNSKSSNSHNLFICSLYFSGSSVFTVVRLEDQKVEIVQELETPYPCNYVICHCQGVLLFAELSFASHVLWNPSTRTHTRFGHFASKYGLCHDPRTGDLKVVIVDEDYYSVWSCKNKSLIINREKFTYPYTVFGYPYNTRVCVDGAIYCVWSRPNIRNETKIIYFDTRDDKFKILEKPESVEERKRIYLVDLGGFLCLHCEGQDKTTIKIWIKEKGIDNNSWNDFITIENVKMTAWAFAPQCLMGNKIVILNGSDLSLVVYSPLEKTFEQFGSAELQFSRLGLIPFLDSPIVTDKTITPKSKRKHL